MTEIVINGWRIFLHPCFLDQYEALLRRVEADRIAHPQTYLTRRSAKLLAAVRKVAFQVIPADPADAQFRLGDTLGKGRKHWFRAKFLQQYRLFFRYRQEGRIIVLAWVNDEGTKRAYESSTDAYATFAAMLGQGQPPDDWGRLLAECEAAGRRGPAAIGRSPDPG